MTQEQLMLELFDGLIRLQGQTNDVLVAIKGLNQKTIWDKVPANFFSFLSIIVAAAALYFTHRQNKRSEQLPYLKMLHDELNDIIISIYRIMNDPIHNNTASKETADLQKEIYDKTVENYLNGSKYFVISSISTDHNQVFNLIKNTGRRVMYFDLLKDRYVAVYEALDKATKQFGKRQPLFAYFKLADYERIYLGFRDMPDIKTMLSK